MMGGIALTQIILGERIILAFFTAEYAGALWAFYALSFRHAAAFGSQLVEPVMAGLNQTQIALRFHTIWAGIILLSTIPLAPVGAGSSCPGAGMYCGHRHHRRSADHGATPDRLDQCNLRAAHFCICHFGLLWGGALFALARDSNSGSCAHAGLGNRRYRSVRPSGSLYRLFCEARAAFAQPVLRPLSQVRRDWIAIQEPATTPMRPSTAQQKVALTHQKPLPDIPASQGYPDRALSKRRDRQP